jgi:membrane associated rhomboid family serine protease
VALTLIDLAVQCAMSALGARGSSVVGLLGLIPSRFVGWTALGGQAADPWRFLPLGTSMFLHDGWLHVCTNMVYLWTFGRALEHRLGRGSFLGLYIFTGVAAAMGQVVAHPHSNAAMIGASGAIAGVLGAYLVYFPRAKIIVAFPFLGLPFLIELRAGLLLLGWFGIQVARGVADVLAAQGDPQVAWWAHTTGFLAGTTAALVARALEAPLPAATERVRPAASAARMHSLVPAMPAVRPSRTPGPAGLRPSFAP